MGLRSLVPPQAAGRTEAVRSVRRAKNKERTRRSLFFGGPKAEYFAGEAFRFQMGLRSLVPPQAAGRTEAVRSVRRAKNKERTRRSLFFGGPAQNRTAVLQGSSADPTRLVGDRSRARKVHRRPFRTHASENRSAAGEVSRRKEFPTGLTPRFRPWADERRRSLKS